MVASNHLEGIITNQNRVTNMQVVFLDIEKYSKRRTSMQVSLIDQFTGILKKALDQVGKAYLDYAQKNNLNFKNDIILIPTGDGAAVVFPFEALPGIHLDYAKEVLLEIFNINSTNHCEEFMSEGWCNCHPNLNVRIGIAEGKGIIYKDINGNYNVAGNVINMASRVMGLADSNQIIFTKDAHDQLIDLIDIPDLYKQFIEYNDIEIKHGVKISVYHFTGHDEEYLNRVVPDKLYLRQRTNLISKKMKNISLGEEQFDEKKMLEFFEGFIGSISGQKSIG
ncbi:adenylate/guanylate cyclase domain-containing protein [Desulfosporosinus sp.]|uniref:adenylate/guanylate cyclase domain-containing protein n=1 Tax=Desulfosporosinus sp. TaxID=157907 RepID=UPI0025B898D8|nr:adenylate/guanylate cyclase domain-containing protein [Desulfosporosinus sp.]MBC2728607.1 hypothetical protein [Desulfosporosinus sp.]